jgi:hypothetical protein
MEAPDTETARRLLDHGTVANARASEGSSEQMLASSSNAEDTSLVVLLIERGVFTIIIGVERRGNKRKNVKRNLSMSILRGALLKSRA